MGTSRFCCTKMLYYYQHYSSVTCIFEKEKAYNIALIINAFTILIILKHHSRDETKHGFNLGFFITTVYYYFTTINCNAHIIFYCLVATDNFNESVIQSKQKRPSSFVVRQISTTVL